MILQNHDEPKLEDKTFTTIERARFKQVSFQVKIVLHVKCFLTNEEHVVACKTHISDWHKMVY